jgi:hypothetical protein
MLDECKVTVQVKDVQQMLKGVVSSFLLCSINYPDMFRLPNAIFRGLHYPYISYSSFLVCVSGDCGLLLRIPQQMATPSEQ